jgi:hypothetical protein
VKKLSSGEKSPEPRTIGIKWPWVDHVDTIGANVMPAKHDLAKEIEGTRQTAMRCLQSLVHTFSGLNVLMSTEGSKGAVLMPVELRQVAAGLRASLSVVRTLQQGLSQAQAHTMCARLAACACTTGCLRTCVTVARSGAACCAHACRLRVQV